MTNAMIIGMACAQAGITEGVDTYAGWNRRGYQVKKGSKALFKTRIWKPVKAKKIEAEDGSIKDSPDMILVKAYFFGESQVEKNLQKK